MMMMMIYIIAGWQLDVYKTFHNMAVISFIKNFLIKKLVPKAL
jgi:hypothetical protein